MKLQSFIKGMMTGIVIGILSASVSKGELGSGFVRRVLNLRDSLSEAHDSAEEEVSEKLSELKNEEEKEVDGKIDSMKEEELIIITKFPGKL